MHRLSAAIFCLSYLLYSSLAEVYVQPGSRYPYPRPEPQNQGQEKTTSKPDFVQFESRTGSTGTPTFYPNHLIYAYVSNNRVAALRKRQTEEYAQYPLEYVGPMDGDVKPSGEEELLWKIVKPCANCAVDRKHVTATPESLKPTTKPVRQ